MNSKSWSSWNHPGHEDNGEGQIQSSEDNQQSPQRAIHSDAWLQNASEGGCPEIRHLPFSHGFKFGAELAASWYSGEPPGLDRVPWLCQSIWEHS